MSLERIAPRDSGVYRAPPDLAPLRAALEEAGGAWFDADLAGVTGKARLLSRLAEACGFPSTFGANWDAASDSLQDLSWCPRPAYVLHLRNAVPASAALGEDWAVFLELLAESAACWAGRGTPFVVLLEGAAELPQWR
jgi:hypothetical protein